MDAANETDQRDIRWVGRGEGVHGSQSASQYWERFPVPAEPVKRCAGSQLSERNIATIFRVSRIDRINPLRKRGGLFIEFERLRRLIFQQYRPEVAIRAGQAVARPQVLPIRSG